MTGAGEIRGTAWLGRRAGWLAVLAGFLPGLWAGSLASAETPRPITLFAAASTAEALGEAVERFEARQATADGLRVTTVFAASSTLAKQVAQGAPADLVLLANPQWMDYLAGREAIEPDSRADLLGNGLVVIAPGETGHGGVREVGTDLPLSARLNGGYLAIGDPDHVPAGIYAKAALETLDLWTSVEARTLRAAHVRAALALVERGEAAAGIVYRSDALAFAERVRIIAELPAGSHPPVIYPLALVSPRRSADAEALYRFLVGPEAAAIFRVHGFSTPGQDG